VAISNGVFDVQGLREMAPAAALLKPLRTAILAQAGEPISARELGAALGLSRQRAGYHVRALARVGLLRRAGRRRRRALTEQRWVASARAYVLAPEALGPLGADPKRIHDRLSASYLLATAARLQGDVLRAAGEAEAQGARLATLTLEADLRFTGAEQRARFAAALRDAVAAVIAKHAAPAIAADGCPGEGAPYRLVLGVHGMPLAPRSTDQAGVERAPPPEPPATREEGSS
jgi:DNA-binding transcriptional ArsR family regulator